MLNSSESEDKVVESLSLQYVSKFCRSKITYQPPIFCVYQRHFEMIKTIVSIPNLGLDERNSMRDLVYGKYDKVVLVDNNLSESFQFPAMKHELYIESVMREDGSVTIKVKTDFRGIQQSTLLNLRILLVFGTKMETMQCTKLLVSRMHGGLLWLDKAYQFMQSKFKSSQVYQQEETWFQLHFRELHKKQRR